MNGEIAESIAKFLKRYPGNDVIECFNTWSQTNKLLLTKDTNVTYSINCFEHFLKNREQLNEIVFDEEEHYAE